ncbi:MAG: hypothetical protein Q7S19_02400 [bacterium]|nr:hypothetical protein [bacterium]
MNLKKILIGGLLASIILPLSTALALTPLPTFGPAVNLRINDSTGQVAIFPGDSVTLSWSPSGTGGGCTASGGWSGAKSISAGSEKLENITEPKTFTLTCVGAAGTVSNSVSVVMASNVSKPEIFSIQSGDKTLHITWTKVKGVDGYYIYRSNTSVFTHSINNKVKDFKDLEDINDPRTTGRLTYTDNDNGVGLRNLGVYCYKISAYVDLGNQRFAESPVQSLGQCSVPKSTTPPVVPVNPPPPPLLPQCVTEGNGLNPNGIAKCCPGLTRTQGNGAATCEKPRSSPPVNPITPTTVVPAVRGGFIPPRPVPRGNAVVPARTPCQSSFVLGRFTRCPGAKPIPNFVPLPFASCLPAYNIAQNDKVFVEQQLSGLKVTCKDNKLIDGTVRPIAFFRPYCGGAAPSPAILAQEKLRLENLRAQNTVIVINCNLSDLLNPSVNLPPPPAQNPALSPADVIIENTRKCAADVMNKYYQPADVKKNKITNKQMELGAEEICMASCTSQRDLTGEFFSRGHCTQIIDRRVQEILGARTSSLPSSSNPAAILGGMLNWLLGR